MLFYKKNKQKKTLSVHQELSIMKLLFFYLFTIFIHKLPKSRGILINAIIIIPTKILFDSGAL